MNMPPTQAMKTLLDVLGKNKTNDARSTGWHPLPDAGDLSVPRLSALPRR